MEKELIEALENIRIELSKLNKHLDNGISIKR